MCIKKHTESAVVPTRGSSDAAGYDLYSTEEKVVPGKGKALIGTEISITVPPGTYGRIAPRSGLASKFMIATGAGVIDAVMSSAAGYKCKMANFCELCSRASPARHHNHRPTTRWLQSTSPTVICLADTSLTTMFSHQSYAADHGGPRSNS